MSFFFLFQDQLYEMAEFLVRENKYPYEMMPVLYALVKSTSGQLDEANKLLLEGNKAVQSKANSKNCDSSATDKKNGNIHESRDITLENEPTQQNLNTETSSHYVYPVLDGPLDLSKN